MNALIPAAGGIAMSHRKDPEYTPQLRELERFEAEVAELAKKVDLTDEFSPVLMWGGDALGDAVEVSYKTREGEYLIASPYRVVTADELRVMRARYLVLVGREFALWGQPMTLPAKKEI